MTMNRENCDRCHKPTDGMTIMSMYNEQIICMECKGKERQRPDYQKAVQADVDEINKGNYNFKGIGLKDDNQ
jgi:recombinational DNA repair protein (RecF pathway)